MNELPSLDDGRRDFDFLAGEWRSAHKRLTKPLSGSGDWEEFTGRSWNRLMVGGVANVDEILLHRPEGDMYGMSVRVFDPDTRTWSIYWATSRGGDLGIPMRGGFADGLGTFHAHEPWDGRWILCRFLWSNITSTGCRWQQAFSVDGGGTWETNWIADFTRV